MIVNWEGVFPTISITHSRSILTFVPSTRHPACAKIVRDSSLRNSIPIFSKIFIAPLCMACTPSSARGSIGGSWLTGSLQGLCLNSSAPLRAVFAERPPERNLREERPPVFSVIVLSIAHPNTWMNDLNRKITMITFSHPIIRIQFQIVQIKIRLLYLLIGMKSLKIILCKKSIHKLRALQDWNGGRKADLLFPEEKPQIRSLEECLVCRINYYSPYLYCIQL